MRLIAVPRLAPRALRDIQAGQAAGRFTVTDAEIALSAVAAGLLTGDGTATPSSRLGTATAMVTSLNRFSML